MKESAILDYHTQIRVTKKFLLSFVRSSELFGRYPDFNIPKLSPAPGAAINEVPAIAEPC